MTIELTIWNGVAAARILLGPTRRRLFEHEAVVRGVAGGPVRVLGGGWGTRGLNSINVILMVLLQYHK